jgi:peptide-methionine (S)-S-oxide reductase
LVIQGSVEGSNGYSRPLTRPQGGKPDRPASNAGIVLHLNPTFLCIVRDGSCDHLCSNKSFREIFMLRHSLRLAGLSGLMLLGTGLVGDVSVFAKDTATAIFAGGCFWSVQSDMDHAPGVIKTTTGYMGGTQTNPTYEQVGTETTGYREAVKVEYDPSVTSYAKLLDAYWHLTDPTDDTGQFCDKGDSYRPALFPLDKAQYDAATASKAEIGKDLGKPVVTGVIMGDKLTFWPAEAYHQEFWKGTDQFQMGYTRADWYKAYRQGCGKNAAVATLWGDKAFEGLNGHE